MSGKFGSSQQERLNQGRTPKQCSWEPHSSQVRKAHRDAGIRKIKKSIKIKSGFSKSPNYRRGCAAAALRSGEESAALVDAASQPAEAFRLFGDVLWIGQNLGGF